MQCLNDATSGPHAKTMKISSNSKFPERKRENIKNDLITPEGVKSETALMMS